MAKIAGRKQLLKKAAVTIAGIRVLGISNDNTSIDVTDSDSTGIQTLLSDYGLTSLSITVSGVSSDYILRDIAMLPATSKLITDLTFVFGDALIGVDVLAGNFFMTSYVEDADYKDAVMFSATFVSSGTWTRS